MMVFFWKIYKNKLLKSFKKIWRLYDKLEFKDIVLVKLGSLKVIVIFIGILII